MQNRRQNDVNDARDVETESDENDETDIEAEYRRREAEQDLIRLFPSKGSDEAKNHRSKIFTGNTIYQIWYKNHNKDILGDITFTSCN